MGNIVGENFNKYVVDQVKIRQEILGSANKTNEQLVWENSRTGWVKLVSSADLVDPRYLPSSITSRGYTGNEKLAERFVLFNGVTNEIPTILPNIENIQRAGIGLNNAWSGNNAYGLGGSDFGLQPMPGIRSATIKTETRGTLKTGTVNIKANNKQQFEIINTLYLRLGYMVLLEWGNNCYYDNKGTFISDNNSSLADPFLRKTYDGDVEKKLGTKIVTYNNLLKAVEIKRESSCGNYDALVGKVVNFNWTFNKDGSYDIVVIIRSIGDIIESLKTNILLPGPLTTSTPGSTPATTPTVPPTAEEIITSYAQSSTIAEYFAEIQRILSFDASEEASSVNGFISTFKNNNNIVDFCSPKYSNGSSAFASSNQYFIRLGTFLNFLEKNIIPEIKNSDKAKDSGKLITFDTDIETNLIHTLPNQISSDPRVCIFRKTVTYYSNPTNSVEFYNVIEDFTGGKLMNVYFNVVYILKLLNDLKDKDGNVTIIDLLNTMMTGFCKATGNYNKISTRVNSDTYDIVFIDETIIPNRDSIITNKESVQFNIYGFQTDDSGSLIEGSFVRDLQLKTEITPDLATMITIGATRAGYVTGQDATLLSNLNKGTQDRIKPEILSPPSTKRNSSEQNKEIIDVYKEAQEAFDAFTRQFVNQPFSSYSNTSPPLWNEDLYSNFTNTQVQLLEYEQKQSTNNNRYKITGNDYYAPGSNPYASSPNNGFLPFNLSLTMDGLAGMKIYQKYNIDSRFLPSNYPEAMDFIIKGVSNTIENNVWITNIESLAIPRVTVTKKSTTNNTPTRSTRSQVRLYEGSVEASETETINFLIKILNGIGISNPNANQIQFMRAWKQAEKSQAAWNPLNTTLLRPGSLPHNETEQSGFFVQNYTSEAQGLEATISTLKPKYNNIIDSIKAINNNKNTITTTMEKVTYSQWGTKFFNPNKQNRIDYRDWITLNNLLYKTPIVIK